MAVSKGFLLVNEQGADMQGPDEVPADFFSGYLLLLVFKC